MVALVGLLVVVGVLVYATWHLDFVAEWAVERVFPGVDVRMKSLRAASFSELDVRELELRSKATDELLLRLDGGSVGFQFADLVGWRLEEVRLKNPSLRVSPGLGKALGIGGEDGGRGGEGEPGEAAAAWGIGRVVIENGTLTVASFFDRTPTVTMKLSADWKNFGIGGNAGDVPHELAISDVAVRRGDADPFLRLDAAVVGFTTAGLFTGRRVESLDLAGGELRLPSDWAAMVPEAGGGDGDAASPEEGGDAKAGWSVGALDLEDFSVAVGPAEFLASAKLREVAMGNGTDVQRVELRKVRVAGADGEALVTANRAVAEFTVAGAMDQEVKSVRLGNPSVRLRPGAFAGESESVDAGKNDGAEEGTWATWKVGRLFSDYGEVRLVGMGGKIPEMSAKVAFDLKDLGTTEEVIGTLHAVTVWDVLARTDGAVGPFLTLDLAKVGFSVAGLMRDKVVASVTVDGGELTIGEQLRGLLGEEGESAGGEEGETGGEDNKPWTIGALNLENLRTKLEDERVDVTDVDFTINSAFKNVAIGAARDGLAEEVQTVEFANLEIRSPLDPAAKIVTLRSVFVRFTLSGLANQRVREVVILRPTIFLSQDLFVYMEAATGGGEEGGMAGGGEGSTGAGDGSGQTALALRSRPEGETSGSERINTVAPSAPGWGIDRLDVKYGSLVIGSGGRSDVGLPLEFETLAENVEFDNLAALKLQAALRIPKQSYVFNSYQLELQDVEGDLQFSYPPESGVKNVVQKLDIDEIKWRQYEAGEAWVAVTFDETGINGEFGAEAYAGYVNGGFSFFFQTDSPWIGWVAGTAVDTKTLTGILSPENFSLTGPVDFEVQVDAFSKAIDRVRGKFSLTEPGKLRIGKLDDLLENLSPDWGSVKRSLTTIGLETLRDFDYADAKGDFWFVQSQGILKLDLAGPDGSRKFEVALHEGGDAGGRWSVGELGPKP